MSSFLFLSSFLRCLLVDMYKMYIATQLIVVKNEAMQSLLIGEWIKYWDIHVMQYYTAEKIKELLL